MTEQNTHVHVPVHLVTHFFFSPRGNTGSGLHVCRYHGNGIYRRSAAESAVKAEGALTGFERRRRHLPCLRHAYLRCVTSAPPPSRAAILPCHQRATRTT